MRCRHSRDLIAAHGLGLPLPGAREAEWRKHVADCAECRRRWADAQRAVEDLRQAFAYPEPAFLTERILRRAAAARPEAAPLWPAMLNWVSATVAIAMALISLRLLAQPAVPLVDFYVLDGRTVSEVVQNNPERIQYMARWAGEGE